MRTLGIDIGTGSLGWAICEKEGRNGTPVLKEHGIMVFPEGIDRDQTGEKPKNQQRRLSRGTRRRYFRRKRRKQMLLKELIANGLCPLSKEALARWVKDDIYPDEEAFRTWFKTQPFELRAEATERAYTAHELGRVIYHMGQRRGFRSNRKGGDKGDQKALMEGDAKRGIKSVPETEALVSTHGSLAKAAVFLNKQAVIEPIRRRFIKRDTYTKEFEEVWLAQRELLAKGSAAQRALAERLTDKLKERIGHPFDGIIFFQRPLRSQKGSVGKCRFEPKKARAPQCSLVAEVFEVLQTVNNIKVDGKPLSDELRNLVINELFLKKDRFTAEDLNKALLKWKVDGRSNYAGTEAKNVKFKGAEAIKDLASLFNKDKKEIQAVARAIFDNPEDKLWLDRWAAIRDAENDDDITKEKAAGRDVGKKRDLFEYAKTQWGFNDDKLKQLMKMQAWKQGYANMSTKAMRKMIPWLRQGMIFSHAAFVANVDEAFGERWKTMTAEQQKNVVKGMQDIVESMRVEKGRVELLNGLIKQFKRHWDETKQAHGFWNDARRAAFDKSFNDWATKDLAEQLGDAQREELRGRVVAEFDKQVDEHGVRAPFITLERTDEKIAHYLTEHWQVDADGVGKLYHPADIELYPQAKGDKLGSPFHPALKNPVAIKALHALRMLMNALLGNGAIDRDTRIRIELARELNSTNERRAWQWYQNDMYERRRKAEAECKKWFDAHMPGASITEDAIQRVWLMQETEEVLGQAKCVYTDRSLEMDNVLGDRANVDIEHTWPIWRSLDDSLANKMLCDREYNRAPDGKHNSIPAELPNWKEAKNIGGRDYPALLANVEKFREMMERYKHLVEIRKQDSKHAADPDTKSKAIVQKHYYNHHYRYWKTKYEHFSLEAIPLGFTNRQQVEVGMITRYSRAYLRTLFPRVDSVKGSLVELMRREWMGEAYEEKNPKSPQYRSSHFHHLVDAVVLASTDKDLTDNLGHQLREKEKTGGKIKPKKPWENFSSDVLKLKDRVLVYHYSTDPLGRTSRYKVKIKGKQRIVTGSTVRGGLHKETIYGRILKKNAAGVYVPRIVLRSMLADLKPGDVANIVDKKLQDRIAAYGLEKAQTEGGYRWEITRKDGTTATHIVRKVRLFDRLDSPLEIKAHRDRAVGREHKHFQLAANEDNHFMAVYENDRGDRSFHILTLFELTQALRNGNRKNFPNALFPLTIEREVRGRKVPYQLMTRGGKPVVLHKDQMVLLFAEGPEEVAWSDKADLNARLYKIRSFEGDGRVMLMHHMEARPASKVDKASEFSKTVTDKRVRLSLNNLNGLFENVDFKSHPNEVVVRMDEAHI